MTNRTIINHELLTWIYEQIAICEAILKDPKDLLADEEIAHYDGKIEAYKSIIHQVGKLWGLE